ncbi:DUF1846 domain-containing protein [Guggenheimella bovis]
MKIGFDHEKYLEEQSKFILERVHQFDKLYLEFGGKLFNDAHAKRVLPGFDPNAKVKLLHRLKDQVEVIICIYAGDIERNKINDNLGISYEMEVLKLIDDLRDNDILVNGVVITRYAEQPAADIFINRLERRDVKVTIHRPTAGYPTDVDVIVSEEGYGKNPFVETTKPIVVVTAPGPSNGKLATCLNQLYHESKRGVKAGYSKFETFPVWNLPLKHPVNIAYEAATVDLKDINMIDFYHVDAYDELSVNYNRDLETFPVLKRILEKITGKESPYQSPTDMGVNRVGFGIIDDEIVKEAAKQEIIRRYFKTAVDYKLGRVDSESYERIRLILERMELTENDRKVVPVAREKAQSLKDPNSQDVVSTVALELDDGTIVTGKMTDLMQASASALLNALKIFANISDSIHLLPPVVLEPIQRLKKNLKQHETRLDLEEVLIALTISAATNPLAEAAFKKLSMLSGSQLHSTTILNKRDSNTLRHLGIEATSDPVFASESLYYNN